MAVTLGLRPRLLLDVPGIASEVGKQIQTAASIYAVTRVENYLVIKIPEDRQHYWSPQLQVELEDRDGTVHVAGLFTPMPAVWTLFAGAYAVILVLGFFSSLYGLAMHQLGNGTRALWAFPIALFFLACVYAAAQFGQRVGHEQTEELEGFLRGCLHEDPEAP